MDEDISEEEYQEWDQSLRLVEKTVSGWSGTPMVIVLNTERGNSLKSMNSQKWAVSEFKDPISEYKEKWKDQNDDLSDGIMNRLRDLGYA